MITQELRAGDRVGFARFSTWGIAHSADFGIVTKIHKNGRIVVQGGKSEEPITFTKHGEEVGRSEYTGRCLMAAIDLEERLARDANRRDRNARANAFKKLVEETLRGHTNGMGDVFEVPQEEKDAMIAAINAL